jgi:predicted ester cyclase
VGDLTKTVRQCWEAMERGDFEAISEFMADDVVMEMPGAVFEGVPAVVGMCEGWWAAFPDLHHETLEELEADGSYACRLHITGKHDGPFVTPAGEIAPTGRAVVLVSADYIVAGPDGRIARWHAYPDMAGLLAQLTAPS